MEELFRLVRDENDIDKALSMIRSGYMLEPSYKDQYNCSLLFHAVYRKSLVLVKTLAEKGANIHARANWGYTVLFYAVIKGSLADVRYLVDKGADLNAKDKTHIKLVNPYKL